MTVSLVTGGAGFLGAHLCRRLLDEGHYVICLDDFSTGSPKSVKNLKENKNFRFKRGNVQDGFSGNVDFVWNLACPASPKHYQKDPLRTLQTCFAGTDRMLELCLKWGARFLQASTSEVYGDPKVSPQKETYWGSVNPIGVRSCYDEGKRVAETLCFDYARSHGVAVRVARIFNTYGPGMRSDDGRVVSNFIVQALNGDPITVYGTGKQTRSFCYVDDMIDGLWSLMNSDIQGPVNLGNPHEIEVNYLAQTIVALTESNSSILHCILPRDDPQRRKPCIELAKEKLGWVPTTTLQLGLSRTIEYFRS